MLMLDLLAKGLVRPRCDSDSSQTLLCSGRGSLCDDLQRRVRSERVFFSKEARTTWGTA